MRLGTSLVLLALGAILKYAVTDRIADIDLSTVGVILMVVGAIGLLLTLLLGATGPRDGPVVRERDVY